MAEISLQDHRSLIIRLYKQELTEEEIVDELCRSGVGTTFSEILHCLEEWHVIPCPSPVYSNDTDTDNASDQLPRTSPLKLGVTCHHGESSHHSAISTAGIASDAKPAEKYRQNRQSHEELALGFLMSNEERARRIGSVVDDSTINDMRSITPAIGPVAGELTADDISNGDSEEEDQIRQTMEELRKHIRQRREELEQRKPRRLHRKRFRQRDKSAKNPRLQRPHGVRDERPPASLTSGSLQEG